MAKKLLTFILALAAFVCVLPMRGETPTIPQKEIPIRRENNTNHPIRSLCEIQAFYYGMLSTVHTTVFSNLGEIDVTVINCSTGEIWEDTFDSSTTSQHLLQISGTSGFYEVTYLSDSGNLYEGSFIIE